MFIERLINQGNAPLAEQVMRFTAARHQLLTQNIANVSTPGYRNLDLDVDTFQQLLRDRVQIRRDAAPGAIGFADITGQITDPNSSLLFHDQNNRSMEQLVTDGAKNALMHNLVVEILKKQFGSLESALRERIT